MGMISANIGDIVKFHYKEISFEWVEDETVRHIKDYRIQAKVLALDTFRNLLYCTDIKWNNGMSQRVYNTHSFEIENVLDFEVIGGENNDIQRKT